MIPRYGGGGGSSIQQNGGQVQPGSLDNVGPYSWPEDHLSRTLEGGAISLQVLSPVST